MYRVVHGYTRTYLPLPCPYLCPYLCPYPTLYAVTPYPYPYPYPCPYLCPYSSTPFMRALELLFLFSNSMCTTYAFYPTPLLHLSYTSLTPLLHLSYTSLTPLSYPTLALPTLASLLHLTNPLSKHPLYYPHRTPVSCSLTHLPTTLFCSLTHLPTTLSCSLTHLPTTLSCSLLQARICSCARLSGECGQPSRAGHAHCWPRPSTTHEVPCPSIHEGE